LPLLRNLRNAQNAIEPNKLGVNVTTKYAPTSFGAGYLPDIRRFHFFPSSAQEALLKKNYLLTFFFGIFGFCFCKYVRGVFELLLQRNGQKRDKKSKGENDRKKKKKRSAFNFFVKVFDVDY
jgi:hypothetical protein